MSLSRGPFMLRCDAPDCGEYVDLETFDFEEACRLAQEARDQHGWINIRIPGGKFADRCPHHRR